MLINTTGHQKPIPTNPFLLFVFLILGALLGLFLSLCLDIGLTKLRQMKAAKLESCHRSSEERHHVLMPLCSGFNAWGNEVFSVHTNSIGFRDAANRVISHDSQTKRVLFLGDSFTEGAVPWEQSIVGQIGRMRDDIELLNGGLGSYSPTNYLNVVKWLSNNDYRVDLAVVLIDISDIQDEAAIYQDSIGGDIQPLQFIDPKLESASIIPSLLRFFQSSTSFARRVIESVYRFLVSHGVYYLPTSWCNNLFDNSRSAWTYRTIEVDLVSRPAFDGYSPLGVEGGLRKASHKMTELYEKLSELGVPLVLVVYPWPAQLIHDNKNSRGVLFWKNWCEGKCLHFIDTFEDFFSRKKQCPPTSPGCWYEDLFIFGDVHYNSKGNSIISSRLAPFL